MRLKEGKHPSPGHSSCRSLGRLEVPRVQAWSSLVLVAGEGIVLAEANLEEQALLSCPGVSPWCHCPLCHVPAPLVASCISPPVPQPSRAALVSLLVEATSPTGASSPSWVELEVLGSG